MTRPERRVLKYDVWISPFSYKNPNVCTPKQKTYISLKEIDFRRRKFCESNLQSINLNCCFKFVCRLRFPEWQYIHTCVCVCVCVRGCVWGSVVWCDSVFYDWVVRKGNRTNCLSFMEVSSNGWRTEVLTKTACKISVVNLQIYWNWEPCFFYLTN